MKTSKRDNFRFSAAAQAVVGSLPLLLLMISLVLLSACASSAPKPPQPDDSNRRPANTPEVIDLQRCRSDLQNNAILLRESSAAAQRAAATAARLEALRALENHARSDRSGSPAESQHPAETSRNVVYTIRFALGSAAVPLSRSQIESLAAQAADAPLIVLRGRTDGQRDSLADDRLARERAEAVRALLIQEGLASARIRATWQGSGDHAVDNDSAAGRELNRRVEIEIYRQAPSDQPLPINATH